MQKHDFEVSTGGKNQGKRTCTNKNVSQYSEGPRCLERSIEKVIDLIARISRANVFRARTPVLTEFLVGEQSDLGSVKL